MPSSKHVVTLLWVSSFVAMAPFSALAAMATPLPAERAVHPAGPKSPLPQLDSQIKVAQSAGRVLNQFGPQGMIDMDATAQSWNSVLQRYVSEADDQGVARFDYAGLKSSSEDYQALQDYIEYLEAQDPDDYEEAEALAYWANLYNAVTVRLIVDHYPVSSIRKIKSGVFSIGPWGKKLMTVNGEALSLDDVEHGIMRKQYPSPLIHYMVNCASIGCPNLKNSLWRAETLSADQDAAARAFVNSSRGVNIGDDGLTVSTIFKWYKVDFGGSNAGVLDHIRNYADPELASAIDNGIRIDGHDYDWALNAPGTKE